MARKLPTDPASLLQHRARTAFGRKTGARMCELRSQIFEIAGLTYVGVECLLYGEQGTYVLENTKLSLVEFRRNGRSVR